MHHGAKASTFRNAEYLRNNPTKAEEILWNRLNSNQIEGVHFRRQHPFYNYVPDFYANEVKLVIELDGTIHEEKSVQFSDEDRELNLELFGLNILRYPNEIVYNFEDDVVQNIRETVIELKAKKFH